MTAPELHLPQSRYEADAPAQLANDRALETWARQIRNSLIPTGAMFDYGGDTAPEGFVLADGAAISRSTYAALFAIYGTKYGAGDGSTTFNLPNFKGRVAVGRDAAQTEFDVLGETGGAKTEALAISQMPSHGHGGGVHAHGQDAHDHNAAGMFEGYYIDTDGPQNLARGSDNNINFSYSPGRTPTIHNSGTVVSNEGGGGTHNNLQPYVVVNVIIKV